MLNRFGARRLIAAGSALVLWGPGAAGLTATGLPIALAGLLAGALLGVAALIVAPRLPAAWDAQRLPASWFVAVAVVFLVVARLSVFIYDPSRTGWSVLPDSELYVPHSCFTSMTGALGRLDSGLDAYADTEGGPRIAGRFDPDPYFYPPSFLLVPASVATVLQTHEFLPLRSAWFALQALTLMGALVLLAAIIGGPTGVRVLLWSTPAVWLALPVLMNLQTGNFQVSAVALALAGMAALVGGWVAGGGALLALAVTSKLFPGVLVVYLLVARRWSAVLSTAGWGIALALAFAAVYGVGPFHDFFAALPAIQDGTVGITAMLTGNPPDNIANHSFYGLTRKLVALGLPLSASVESLVQTLSGVLVLVIAVVAARRAGSGGQERGRWHEAVVWVALLNLASFRSPFLPDSYAYVGVYCLLALLLAGLDRVTGRAVFVAAAAWLLLSPVDGIASLAFLPDGLGLLLTLFVQVGVIALNVACALDRRFPVRLLSWLGGSSPDSDRALA